MIFANQATGDVFDNYRVIADTIAALFQPHAEVVLHDLRTQTVAYIAQNLSKRDIGDDSALDQLPRSDPRDRCIGPYEKLNWNGDKIRSTSSVLLDGEGKPNYLLCINLNVGLLESGRAALDAFLASSVIQPQPDVLFRDDWQERINLFLNHWLTRQGLQLKRLSRDQKRDLVEALHNEGAFEGRSAANYIANVLNMGRATVYKHLKDLRELRQSA